ncbi:MAG TPA: hypothetical protein VHW09_24325 [Bryobacteraceae bacterium]|jgi:hypothetical protein|nr:hypothetical protein [Bryobacteraceae bacterium]
MRLLLPVALIAISIAAAAQSRGSVSRLVAQVRGDLERAQSDSRIAKDLRKAPLSERLDDRTIEILQSEGAGPETVEELLLLRDRSERMPRPAAPAIPQPPPPERAAQVQFWNAAHDNALHYTGRLPDFICSELIRRYFDSNGKGGWKLDDTLALQLTYFNREEEYKLMTVNNHSTGMSYEQLHGAVTEGEFGSMLAAIFALKSRTNRDWDHWTLLRSRPTHVYTFAIAAANSDYQVTAGGMGDEDRVNVGQHGYVYIDDASKMVVRLTTVADQFPAGFDVRKVIQSLDYDFTDVGGTSYLLPLHSETILWAHPYRRRNETDFLQYRKFSADTTVTYDGPVKK